MDRVSSRKHKWRLTPPTDRGSGLRSRSLIPSSQERSQPSCRELRVEGRYHKRKRQYKGSFHWRGPRRKEGKTHFQMKVLEMDSVYFHFTFETVPRETHGGHRSWEEGHRTSVLSAGSHWNNAQRYFNQICAIWAGSQAKLNNLFALTKQALGRSESLGSCGCSQPLFAYSGAYSPQTSTALPSEQTPGTRPEALPLWPGGSQPEPGGNLENMTKG